MQQTREETLIIGDDHHQLQKFLAELIRLMSGQTREWAKQSNDQVKKMSKLNDPSGIFVSNGEVFIADTYNDRVRKLLRNGQLVTIAGVPVSINKSDPLTKPNNPASVFVSSSDQVYISEWRGHQIRKIDRNGIISTIAGNGK